MHTNQRNIYHEKLFIICFLPLLSCAERFTPVDGLLERIDKGASKKFKIELVKSPKDFFELDQSGKQVVVRGNTWVNIASGINWYLKYYAGVQLSWNGMTAKLPAVLPKVERKNAMRQTSNCAMTSIVHFLLFHGFLGLETVAA